MKPRPQGYREPTDEEMKCLPEGTLTWYSSTSSWEPSSRVGKVAACDCEPSFYVVPITTREVVEKVMAETGYPSPPVGTDPKQQHGEKKPQLHLIPKAALEECAKALELGARKYGERNWVLGDGVQLTTYLSAMARHLALIADGSEDIDPESGAHHLGHIMAGAAIVLDAMRHGKLIDNRVVPTQNG